MRLAPPSFASPIAPPIFFTLFVPHLVALPFGSDFGGRWGDYEGAIAPHFIKKKGAKPLPVGSAAKRRGNSPAHFFLFHWGGLPPPAVLVPHFIRPRSKKIWGAVAPRFAGGSFAGGAMGGLSPPTSFAPRRAPFFYFVRSLPPSTGPLASLSFKEQEYSLFLFFLARIVGGV